MRQRRRARARCSDAAQRGHLDAQAPGRQACDGARRHARCHHLPDDAAFRWAHAQSGPLTTPSPTQSKCCSGRLLAKTGHRMHGHRSATSHKGRPGGQSAGTAARWGRACRSAWHASASCRTSRASLRACRGVSASVGPPPPAPLGRAAPLPEALPGARLGPGGCGEGCAWAAGLPPSGLRHVARKACSAAMGRARRRWCSTAAVAAAGARRTTCRFDNGM